MKILQLKTQGFGCLSGRINFQPEGVNLWIAHNARGKSTLATAILEALYSPPSPDGRRVEHRGLAALKPIEGEFFDVQLDVQVKGRSLCILRDFLAGEIKILEGGLNGKDVTDEFRAGGGEFAIGERLLGLNREEFVRSVFTGQGEVNQVRETTALTGALQRIAAAETGQGTVPSAIEVLDNLVQRYPLARSNEITLATEKKGLQNDLEKAHQQIQELEEKRENIRDKTQELVTLESEISALRSQQERVAYLEQKAELNEIEKRLFKDAKQQERVEKLDEELEELAPYANFPMERQQSFHRYLDDIERTKKDIEQLNVEKSKQQEELANFESQLKEMDFIAEFPQEDRDVLLGIANRLEASERAEKKFHSKVEKERQRLETQGINFQRYEELLERFEPLTSEERQFLRNIFSEHQNRTLRKTEVENQQNSANNIIDEINRQRNRRRKIGDVFLFAGGGALAIGLAVVYTAALIPIGVGVAGFGLIVGLAGILLRQSSGSRSADEFATAQSEMRKAEEILDQIQQEAELETQRLQELSHKIGLSDEAQLFSEFFEFEKLFQETEQLHILMHDYEQAKNQANSLKDEVHPFLKLAGLSDEEVNSSSVKSFIKKVDCALTLKIKRDTAKDKFDQLVEEIEQKKTHLKENNSAVREILSKSIIDKNLTNEKAHEAFDKEVQKAQRRRQLEEEILPEERERLLEEEERTVLCQRKQELQKQIEGAEAREGVDQFAALTPEKSRIDYQREHETLNDQITSKQNQANALESKISNTLKEVRENLPSLLQEEWELKRRLNRAEQFEAAVSIAKETLEQLATKVYKVWAEVLNTFVADAFQKILPHYEDPRFDSNLQFTFAVPGHKGRIDPAAEAGTAPKLSGGELEQIYLIARFAISEYLSHGDVRPPIILDEPFSYSHDDPFVAGMRLLAQLSQQRQVIVLTCHEVRHRWLLQKATELKEFLHEITFEGKCGFPMAEEEAC